MDGLLNFNVSGQPHADFTIQESKHGLVNAAHETEMDNNSFVEELLVSTPRHSNTEHNGEVSTSEKHASSETFTELINVTSSYEYQQQIYNLPQQDCESTDLANNNNNNNENIPDNTNCIKSDKSYTGPIIVCGTCRKTFLLESNFAQHLNAHMPAIIGSALKKTTVLDPSETLKSKRRVKVISDAMIVKVTVDVTPVTNLGGRTSLSTAGERLFHPSKIDSKVKAIDNPFITILKLKTTGVGRPKRDGFECTYCCKQFNTKKDAYEHALNHTNSKILCCDICSFTCRSQRELKLHKKKKHNDNKNGILSSRISTTSYFLPVGRNNDNNPSNKINLPSNMDASEDNSASELLQASNASRQMYATEMAYEVTDDTSDSQSRDDTSYFNSSVVTMTGGGYQQPGQQLMNFSMVAEGAIQKQNQHSYGNTFESMAYKCSYCDLSFPTEETLGDHETYHQSIGLPVNSDDAKSSAAAAMSGMHNPYYNHDNISPPHMQMVGYGYPLEDGRILISETLRQANSELVQFASGSNGAPTMVGDGYQTGDHDYYQDGYYFTPVAFSSNQAYQQASVIDADNGETFVDIQALEDN